MAQGFGQDCFPRLVKLWADNKYHNHELYRWVSENGWYAIEVATPLAPQPLLRQVQVLGKLGVFRSRVREFVIQLAGASCTVVCFETRCQFNERMAFQQRGGFDEGDRGG